MAYLLFVDESGHDDRESPYGVLAGIAVEDARLWEFIKAVRDAELVNFGTKYTYSSREIKAKKLLKRKTFRLAKGHAAFTSIDRIALAKLSIEDGSNATFDQLCALGQAKIEFVKSVLELCGMYRCKAFASILLNPNTTGLPSHLLRKDYIYLFERFFYFLEDQANQQTGIVVFDELENNRSHLLIDQMEKYFKRTSQGRQRSGLIIPEPLFVRSDLTTGIQIADILAYIINWGFRLPDMTKPKRSELDEFVNLAVRLRHKTTRQFEPGQDTTIWSFTTIAELGIQQN